MILVKEKDLNEDEYKKIVELISTLDKEDIDIDWLVKYYRKSFCKVVMQYTMFIMEGIHIIDGKDKKQTAEAMK